MGGNEPDSSDGKTNQETPYAGSILKKRPVCKYFLQKFGSVYGLKQEMSLDEAKISWRGRLIFTTYIPRKIGK